jgi:hypothetical protein
MMKWRRTRRIICTTVTHGTIPHFLDFQWTRKTLRRPMRTISLRGYRDTIGTLTIYSWIFVHLYKLFLHGTLTMKGLILLSFEIEQKHCGKVCEGFILGKRNHHNKSQNVPMKRSWKTLGGKLQKWKKDGGYVVFPRIPVEEPSLYHEMKTMTVMDPRQWHIPM